MSHHQGDDDSVRGVETGLAHSVGHAAGARLVVEVCENA